MLTFKELKSLAKNSTSQQGKYKIAVVGDTATQFFVSALKGYAAHYKISATFFEGDFNQVERQISDVSSDLHVFNPDFLIVFQSSHKLLLKHAKMNPLRKSFLAEERLDFIKSLPRVFPNSKILYLNYPEIDDTVYGSFANRIESSFLWQTRKLNMELMNLSSLVPNFYVCDISSIQNKLGRDSIFRSSIYTNSEMVFTTDALPFVAERVIDVVLALLGNFKKCLILDLDNTIWGGVIGDDGIENIQLGHGIGIGKAFSEFQLWCKKLKERGIILAVCSKNNEETAKEPFLNHPDMVLRLDDIAVFMANWETKVDNIRNIQKILNISFDSMVFLDDNPFERSIVRQNIPEMVVPELPEDPADYLEYLYSQNLFETASASENDDERTKQYQQEAKRVSYCKSFKNEDEFLANLDMVSEISSFNKFNTPRVAQLSQRSNQFNLRTVRYDECDIEKMASDGDYMNFAFTLSDSIGENGLVCVVVLKKLSEREAFIQSWFMSCRVLKRGMENFTLNSIARAAKDAGFETLIGEYIPTKKNGMVEAHYENLGFSKLDDGTGRTMFSLDLKSFSDRKTFIKAK